ncbi:MAG: type IV pilus modification PilV family protein [Verrucomicrobiota bacterium]
MRFAPRPAAARRAHAGFTIMEVVMSTFVMALGIATSIVALQTGFKTVDVARGTTLASQILQSEMERIRLKNWSEIVALSTATDTTDPHPAGSPAGVEMFDGSTNFTSSSDVADKYIITRTVTEDPTRPGEVMYITISVAWTSFDGRSHTRSFQSMYAKDGLYDYYYTLAGGS